MYYDVSRSNRGTSRTPMLYRCDVCKYSRHFTWNLSRYREDEHDEGIEEGETTVCEPCLVDALLDGIRP